MTKKAFFFILVAAFMLMLSAEAMAQRPGWGRWAQNDHRYDVNTVETVEGTVADVKYVAPTPGRGTGPGVHFMLKQGSEMLEVMLGPVVYLNEQAEPFEKGDKVTVVGSRITLDGKPALIAKSLALGDKTITLRDDQGFPKWRGTMRSQGQNMAKGRGMGQERGMGRGMGRGQGAGGGGGCRCCSSN